MFRRTDAEEMAGTLPASVIPRQQPTMPYAQQQAEGSAESGVREDSVDAVPDAGPTRFRAAPTPRVILVSEFQLFLAGLAHVLEGAGMVIAGQFTRSEDAVVFLRSHRAEIALLDIGGQGELILGIERMSSIAPWCRVLVLEDTPRTIDSARLIQLGASGVMVKTVTPEMLVKAVQRVHAGELWLDRMQASRACHVLAQRRRIIDAEGRKMASLTRREHEIIALIGQGLKNAAIGQQLFISESTVRNHLTSILDKLDVTDRFELVVYAFRHGLVRYQDLDTDAQSRPPRTSTDVVNDARAIVLYAGAPDKPGHSA